MDRIDAPHALVLLADVCDLGAGCAHEIVACYSNGLLVRAGLKHGRRARFDTTVDVTGSRRAPPTGGTAPRSKSG